MPKRVVGTPQRRTKKEKKSPNDGHSLKPNEYGFLFRDPLHPNTILFRKERPSVAWDVVEVFDNGSERNFRYYCHGCQAFCRCTTITIIMRHLQDCTLSKIEDEETRMKVLEGLVKNILKTNQIITQLRIIAHCPILKMVLELISKTIRSARSSIRILLRGTFLQIICR